MVKRKRLDAVLRSFITVRSQYDNPCVRLKLIVQIMNQDHERRLGSFKQQVEQSGFSNSIEILSNLTPSAVQEQMRQSSLCILVSESEPAAIVPLEAAANGCAIIVTRSGGTSHYFADGNSGILVGDSETEITNAMRSCLDEEFLLQLRCQGLKVATNLYRSTFIKSFIDSVSSSPKTPNMQRFE